LADPPEQEQAEDENREGNPKLQVGKNGTQQGALSGSHGCVRRADGVNRPWLKEYTLESKNHRSWANRIYLFDSAYLRCVMADTLRITVDELRRRMEAGEDFTVIDVRNPQAWAQSDVTLPEAIRVPLEKLEENLPKIPKDKPIVTYCT
jgi:hypothetical protein